jgi:hypothetical protein
VALGKCLEGGGSQCGEATIRWWRWAPAAAFWMTNGERLLLVNQEVLLQLRTGEGVRCGPI